MNENTKQPSKEKMKQEAEKSPCRVIKFSASDGELFSHNGEFYADCTDCQRTEIEQSYPQCTANHAEWSILAKNPNAKTIYIYCMTPDGKDYHFKRFWCQICGILLPMFSVVDVFMWEGENWIKHDAKKLIEEVKNVQYENSKIINKDLNKPGAANINAKTDYL